MMRRSITWVFTAGFAVTAATTEHNPWWYALAGFAALVLAADWWLEVRSSEHPRRSLLARLKARRALVGQRRP